MGASMAVPGWFPATRLIHRAVIDLLDQGVKFWIDRRFQGSHPVKVEGEVEQPARSQ
jgi:hypothetical protein